MRTSYVPPTAGAVNVSVALEMPVAGGSCSPFMYDHEIDGVSGDPVR